MSHVTAIEPIGPLFRVDKFEVPAESLPKFMHRIHWIQRYLGGLAGCGQNLVLTQTAGPGRFNVVTLVEWANSRDMIDAKARVEEHYGNEGFDPAAFMARLGVQADMGVYASVVAPVNLMTGS